MLDISLIIQSIMSMIGFIQGAAMCESAGIDLHSYAKSLLPIEEEAVRMVDQISHRRFDNPEATLEVWAKGWDEVIEHCAEVGLSGAVPRFIDSTLQKAMLDGYGEEELSALIKTLRTAN